MRSLLRLLWLLVKLYFPFPGRRFPPLDLSWSEDEGETREPPAVQERWLSGLDASAFAPLTTDELRKAFKGFGRAFTRVAWEDRSRIPSAQHPRVHLIDRAMVGLGFITPEELTAAHDVGKRMDGVRGSLEAMREQAEVSVAKSREEREERKKQKREEAARKREERARQVEERRKTDIVFLGRGVSKGLADRRANIERLHAGDLPVLVSPADVARALNVGIGKLRWLAFHSDATRTSHYTRFVVPKKSGGERALFAPKSEIAAAQRWVLDNILAKVPVHDAAHGFVAGRSTVSNAHPHVGTGIVVNVDLKDFFPSVTFPRVKGMFQGLGYSPAVATILGLLCTESPRRTVRYEGRVYHVATGPRALPQGACTSPALSNMVVRRLDARLAGQAEKIGWTYTRYADDMTFSAQSEMRSHVGYLVARIRHYAEQEGFALNESKTRVLERNASQRVTGVVVNDRAGVPRKLVRRMRAILHRAHGEGLEAQNRLGRHDFPSWVAGMIAYIRMVNQAQGSSLEQAWRGLRERP